MDSCSLKITNKHYSDLLRMNVHGYDSGEIFEENDNNGLVFPLYFKKKNSFKETHG